MTHAQFDVQFDVPRRGISAAYPAANGREDDPRGAAGPAKRWLDAAIRLGGAGVIAIVLMAAAPSGASRSGGTVQGTDAAATRLAPGIGAFTYWLHGPGGEVVTLVRVPRTNSADAGTKDRGLVLRFSVVLVPGQTQTLSVPGIDWGNPPTIRIKRVGDTIEVTSSNTDAEGRNF